MRRTKVLVVDDSAVIRQMMTALLGQDPSIEVLQAASDPLIALERMKVCWPDVIVLDIEMPRMDGITFLQKVMRERPTPVVICSSLTAAGTQTTIDALAAGAAAIITKPHLGLRQFLEEAGPEIVATVKGVAGARATTLAAAVRRSARGPRTGPKDAPPRALSTTTDRVVMLGTSTGGTQALEEVLSSLPRVSPGIVIVQHMPEHFTAAFATRLDRLCEIEVREARNGDRVMHGRALIAPGGRQTTLRRNGAQYVVDVIDGPPVNRHRPSVDVLFRSAARSAGSNALGVIMTGMGDDGAEGLLEMRQAGARTLAQDEASCVVYGMPREAVKRGAVERTVPLSAIAREITKQLG